ncbi:MAG: hypothetical protein IPN68_13450 [Bacteroidetes bacterium]|nr:hypothetical protein [Bacteroidota bacterium]
MKLFRLFLIVFFSGIIINLNAQVFVGGSVGFNTSSDKHEGSSDQKSSIYNLNLKPVAGKFLSDKMALGLALDLYLAGGKTESTTETKSRSFGFGVSPFMRYYAVNWNKLSIFGQGGIGLEVSRSSLTTGGTTNDGPKISLIDLNIFPGLSYDISDKISLETSLNIFRLGFSYNTIKDGGDVEKLSNFHFGTGLDNIASLNAIMIEQYIDFK